MLAAGTTDNVHFLSVKQMNIQINNELYLFKLRLSENVKGWGAGGGWGM